MRMILLILFSPTRHDWKEKGNDKMITAFSKFVKVFPKCMLILVDWGFDVHKSKQLITEAGLSSSSSSPINYIKWIKPIPKNQLIQYYNIADIVLDQFTLGSMGLRYYLNQCHVKNLYWYSIRKTILLEHLVKIVFRLY